MVFDQQVQQEESRRKRDLPAGRTEVLFSFVAKTNSCKGKYKERN